MCTCNLGIILNALTPEYAFSEIISRVSLSRKMC